MGLEHGIPPSTLLRWACWQLSADRAFEDVVYNEVAEQLEFTVPARRGVKRRYKLTINGGSPVVEQVGGPPESFGSPQLPD
jgi:hypothetical protein